MPSRRIPGSLPATTENDLWHKSKTLEGAVAPEGIQAIKKLEAEYNRLSADAIANRWETARLYTAELDAGRSQRELARRA